MKTRENLGPLTSRNVIKLLYSYGHNIKLVSVIFTLQIRKYSLSHKVYEVFMLMSQWRELSILYCAPYSKLYLSQPTCVFLQIAELKSSLALPG